LHAELFACMSVRDLHRPCPQFAEGAMHTSTAQLPTLPMPYGMPLSRAACSYGVAINRNQTGGELEQRLVWALTR